MFHLRPSPLMVFALSVLGGAQTQSSSARFFGQEPNPEWISQHTPPATCAVTIPSDTSFVPPYPVPTSSTAQFGLSATGKFGTEKLWTVVPVDGIWWGSVPRMPFEFVYDDKHPWFRVHPAFSLSHGPLTVTGERLDGPAPSFIETDEGGGLPRDDDNAMIMGAIQIPVFGCWKITGQYKDQELSFVVWVAPLPEPKPASDSQAVSPALKEPRRIQVAGEVQARLLGYRVIPEVPHEAEVANISGTVVLHAVIDRDGRPRELKYVSGPPLLAQSAIDAVGWWRYMITEENTEIDTTIQVVFPSGNN